MSALVLLQCFTDTRSVRLTETIEPGDKTAVRFTQVFNNDVINKNTAVRFTWFQTRFQNSFETFETMSVRFTETNQELGSLGLSRVRAGFFEPNPSSENQVHAKLALFDLLTFSLNFYQTEICQIVQLEQCSNTRICENYFSLMKMLEN